MNGVYANVYGVMTRDPFTPQEREAERVYRSVDDAASREFDRVTSERIKSADIYKRWRQAS